MKKLSRVEMKKVIGGYVQVPGCVLTFCSGPCSKGVCHGGWANVTIETCGSGGLPFGLPPEDGCAFCRCFSNI